MHALTTSTPLCARRRARITRHNDHPQHGTGRDDAAFVDDTATTGATTRRQLRQLCALSCIPLSLHILVHILRTCMWRKWNRPRLPHHTGRLLRVFMRESFARVDSFRAASGVCDCRDALKRTRCTYNIVSSVSLPSVCDVIIIMTNCSLSGVGENGLISRRNCA